MGRRNRKRYISSRTASATQGRHEAAGKPFAAQVGGILNEIDDQISLITRQNRESPSIVHPRFALGYVIGCSNKEVDMKRAFNIAVVILLAYLIAGRALMHAQAGVTGSITCESGANLVRLDALKKGFSESASVGQSENFLSSCLVTGEGRVGDLVAHEVAR